MLLLGRVWGGSPGSGTPVPLASEWPLENPRIGLGLGAHSWGVRSANPLGAPLGSAPDPGPASPRLGRPAHSPRPAREPRGPPQPPLERPPCALAPPPRCSSCCSCWGRGCKLWASRSRRCPPWSLPSWPAMPSTHCPTTWAPWSGWTTPGPGWPSGERDRTLAPTGHLPTSPTESLRFRCPVYSLSRHHPDRPRPLHAGLSQDPFSPWPCRLTSGALG